MIVDASLEVPASVDLLSAQARDLFGGGGTKSFDGDIGREDGVSGLSGCAGVGCMCATLACRKDDPSTAAKSTTPSPLNLL